MGVKGSLILYLVPFRSLEIFIMMLYFYYKNNVDCVVGLGDVPVFSYKELMCLFLLPDYVPEENKPIIMPAVNV